MIRTIGFLLCLLLWVDAKSENSIDRIEGHIIVQLNEGVKANRLSSRLSGANELYKSLTNEKNIFPSLNIHLFKFNEKEISFSEVKTTLSQLPEVLYVQPDRKVATRARPNDLRLSEQWPLEVMRVIEVWDVIQGGTTANGHEIVIAVLDNGFEIEHEDLNTVLWSNEGEIPNDGMDNDNNGYIDDFYGLNMATLNDNHQIQSHGTSVAGIAGAQGDNNVGISGISWESKLMLISQASFESRIFEAYTYILEERKKFNESNGLEGSLIVVTNFSLGIDDVFADQFPLWCSVYDMLGAEGILNVCATTNNESNVDLVGDMPSTCSSEYLIAVTNTDISDEKAEESGFGSVNVDLGAPGDGSFSLKLDNGYGSFGGTSASSPHVAGSIALLYSIPCQRFADLVLSSPVEAASVMKQAILEAVDPKTSLEGRTTTGGRINVFESLLRLSSFCDGSNGDLTVNRIYPNPAFQESVTIAYETPDFNPYTISVFDATGKLLEYQEIIPPLFDIKTFSLNVTAYNAGIYYFCIYNDDDIQCGSFLVP